MTKSEVSIIMERDIRLKHIHDTIPCTDFIHKSMMLVQKYKKSICYNIDYFEFINNGLRNNVISNTSFEIISDLYSCIDEMPPMTKPITLYRCVDYRDYKIGDIVSDNGFQSKSLFIDTCLNINNKLGCKKTTPKLLLFKYPTGSKHVLLDNGYMENGFSGQTELITYTGETFEVIDMYNMTTKLNGDVEVVVVSPLQQYNTLASIKSKIDYSIDQKYLTAINNVQSLVNNDKTLLIKINDNFDIGYIAYNKYYNPITTMITCRKIPTIDKLNQLAYSPLDHLGSLLNLYIFYMLGWVKIYEIDVNVMSIVHNPTLLNNPLTYTVLQRIL